MSLPIRVKNVRYKVAGKYAYQGDMIITAGVMYYFPHTDLIQRRINRAVDAMAFAAGGLAGDFIRDLGLADFDKSADPLLQAEGHSLRIQEKLDAYIAELKAKRSSVTLSSYLPIPLRYTTNEIKNLSLTVMGSVQFEAHYDTHFYNAGFARKKVLRTSLIEAGFTS